MIGFFEVLADCCIYNLDSDYQTLIQYLGGKIESLQSSEPLSEILRSRGRINFELF